MKTTHTDDGRWKSGVGFPVAWLQAIPFGIIVALTALLAVGTGGGPAVAQNGEDPAFRDNPVDGAWVGLMQFGNRLLPLQINVNARDGGGVVNTILPEDLGDSEPGELGVHTAVDTESFTGSNEGDDDDGDDGDDGNDDNGDDDDGDIDDDCCYGSDLQVETDGSSHRDRHLQFTVEIPADEDVDGDDDVDDDDVYRREFDLTYDDDDDVLRGGVKSTRPGERRGQVELRRMSPDHPLQRLWTGTANVDGSGRGDVTLLLNQDAPSSFPQVTQAMAASVVGRIWFDGRVGTIEDAELDGNNLEGTVDIPGSSDVELVARLIRKDTRMRARFDGRGGLMRPATTKGKPIKLRRVVDDEVAPGGETTVRIRAKNLEDGALVHFDEPGMRILGIDLVNPRIIDVDVDVPVALAGEKVSVLIVNVDGQEDSATDAISVTGDGGGGASVSFASDVQPIFDTNCALSGCHLGANAEEGQNLEAGESYDNIVEVASNQRPDLFRIDPGNPDDSYLVMKIRGDAGIEGAQMPFERTPLSQAQIDTIVTWVREGAQRN